MDEIRIFYNTSTSGSDTDDASSSSSPPKRRKKVRSKSRQSIYSLTPLPPPPPEINKIPDAVLPNFRFSHAGRSRSFPHVEGNFPVYVHIPVPVTLGAKNILEALLGKASTLLPELRGMEDDVVVSLKRKDSTSRSNAGSNIQIAKEYHISLSRTVPIRIHQIDSLVPMLRHKFQNQKRFWIEFGRWEVFVNDDRTRTFLGVEVVSAGLSEIRKQITLVTEAYKLHGLPPFYEAPRPHISVAWGVGDISSETQRVADELNELCGNGGIDYGAGLQNVLWSYLFAKVECKIGQQTYPIWGAST